MIKGVTYDNEKQCHFFDGRCFSCYICEKNIPEHGRNEIKQS